MKKGIIIIVLSVSLVIVSALVYAATDKISGIISEHNINALMDKAIQADMELKEEITIEQALVRVGKKSSTKSMKDFLRQKGYYEDDINISLKKYAEAVVMYDMTEAESNYIVTLVESGYNYERLIDIYNFLQFTGDNISYMKQIYDTAYPEFDAKFWIENAYEVLTDKNPLTYEDISEYINRGLTIDEILISYEMSLQGIKSIQQILDEKLDGKTWSELTLEAYGKTATFGVDDFADDIDLRMINTAMIIARRTRLPMEDILDNNKNIIKEDAIAKYSDKLKRIGEISSQLQLVSGNDELIIESAQQVLTELSKETVRQLINEGYRIKDIKLALSNDKKIVENMSKVCEIRNIINVEVAE